MLRHSAAEVKNEIIKKLMKIAIFNTWHHVSGPKPPIINVT